MESRLASDITAPTFFIGKTTERPNSCYGRVINVCRAEELHHACEDID